MEKHLISIIIPAYNAQATLERCINSLLAQTYPNIELILINDGSADRTGEILDGFALRDARIHVVHTSNRGVSAARNTGLSLAKGEYIGFVDADDWAEPEMFAHLLHWIQEEQADISVCGWHKETSEISNVCIPTDKLVVLSGAEAYAAALLPDGFKGFLPNKLFRSELIGKTAGALRMDENISVCEDLLFICRCFCHVSTVVFNPTPYYHYSESPNGLTSSPFTLGRATLLDACRQIADLTRGFYPALTRFTENTYLNNIAYVSLLAMHARTEWRLPRADRHRLLRGLFHYINNRRNMTTYKLLNIGLAFFPWAARLLFRLLH